MVSPHFCAWQKAPERLHPGWGPSCLCSVAATGPGEGQGSPCSGEAVGWAARWDLLGGCQLGLVHAPFLSLPFSPSQPSPSLSHIQRGGYFRFCVASQPAELGGGVTVTGTRHSEWEPAPKQPRAQTPWGREGVSSSPSLRPMLPEPDPREAVWLQGDPPTSPSWGARAWTAALTPHWVSLCSALVQPSSQPGSPAPGPPAQMDLEHPPQPLFGTPASLPKKEPPGYEEAVSQQPRQQVKGIPLGQPGASLIGQRGLSERLSWAGLRRARLRAPVLDSHLFFLFLSHRKMLPRASRWMTCLTS